MSYGWIRGNERDILPFKAQTTIVHLAMDVTKVNHTPILAVATPFSLYAWWTSPDCQAKRTLPGSEVPTIKEGGWVEHLLLPSIPF